MISPRSSLFLLITCCITLGQCATYWTWECYQNQCVKQRVKPEETPRSLEICELLCHPYSRLWPMPRNKFLMENDVVQINLDTAFTVNASGSELLNKMMKRFFVILDAYNPTGNYSKVKCKECSKTKIKIQIHDVNSTKLELDIDESYTLVIKVMDGKPAIIIEANTVFGVRNALESLSQIIVYDTISMKFVVPTLVILEDSPIYPIRGLMIDTSRNYLSVPVIKKIIDGMAVNKLNTLHWHITDSQSFPFVSQSLPELSELGAYGQDKVYTFEVIKDLIAWAEVRGVRIIPEFDGPAHVGEGWQDTGLVVCFNQQPWGSYCKEPPCGQFDPTLPELYTTLSKLYKDLLEAFNPVAFHFGGDEVNFNCWRSVASIRDWMTENNMTWFFDSGHIKMWDMYQNRSYNLLMQAAKKQLPAIVWTSTLTNGEHLHNLPNDKYIIHVWTQKHDSTIRNLLKNDYKMILSNYDALYLDCGFHSWTSSDSNNWCSPYITWKKVYDNSPAAIVESFGEDTNKPELIMGSIAALWTETIDDASAENRIWPRTAAMAERIWAEPTTDWSMAQYRLTSHRERMVRLGIQADTLVPEWCNQNQNSCY